MKELTTIPQEKFSFTPYRSPSASGFKKGNVLGFRHGFSKTNTYRKWVCMKWRCKHDPHYLSMGTKVCKRWEKFANFLADMGECPIGFEIDRKKSDGNYEPSNCRWTTRIVNQQNRDTTRFYTHDNLTMCAMDWSKHSGIHYATLLYRLNRGCTITDALTKKKHARI